MLLDRAAALTDRAREHKAKKALAAQAKAFETRARQLIGPTHELVQVYGLANEFKLAGLKVDLATGLAAALAKQAEGFLEAFNADHKVFLNADEALSHQFIPSLKKITVEHRGKLLATWHAVVDMQFSQLPESVLSAIGTITTYRRHVDVIRSRHQEVFGLRSTLPPLGSVSQTVDRVKAAAAGKDAAWRELLGGGIPDEVVEFLARAGSSGFSLASLTPVIDAWLRERGLLGAFQIRSI